MGSLFTATPASNSPQYNTTTGNLGSNSNQVKPTQKESVAMAGNGKGKEEAAAHVSGQANEPLSGLPHTLTAEQLANEIGADLLDGLHETEAKSRVEKYGPNELDDGPGVNPAKILLRQVANAMTLVLILAMAVSFGIGSYIEGGVITAVIVLNITVGFFQEYSAEKTMDSLRSLSSPTANAIREGKNVVVPTAQLVFGDLVEVKVGDTVPADIRLVEAMNFETDEALLTGESLPVAKEAAATFDADTGPGDRLNVIYSSSTVTKGRGRGIVFATGMHTEIGSIAAALRGGNSKRRQVKRKPDGTAKPHRYVQAWALTSTDFVGRFLGVNVGTPLQRKLSKFALLLLGIAVICALIVLGANKFSNNTDVIIYAVATGLSMIPASLIVVLTITMAAGTKRMIKRNVVVRSLDSICEGPLRPRLAPIRPRQTTRDGWQRPGQRPTAHPRWRLPVLPRRQQAQRKARTHHWRRQRYRPCSCHPLCHGRRPIPNRIHG